MINQFYIIETPILTLFLDHISFNIFPYKTY
jgi:hypothetical protein